jgi:hypothetical protein
MLEHESKEMRKKNSQAQVKLAEYEHSYQWSSSENANRLAAAVNDNKQSNEHSE